MCKKAARCHIILGAGWRSSGRVSVSLWLGAGTRVPGVFNVTWRRIGGRISMRAARRGAEAGCRMHALAALPRGSRQPWNQQVPLVARDTL